MLPEAGRQAVYIKTDEEDQPDIIGVPVLMHDNPGRRDGERAGLIAEGQVVLAQVDSRTVQNMFHDRSYRMYLGKHYTTENESGSVAIYPSKIIIHYRWDSNTLRDDIALIKLQSPVTQSDTIMPVCLPTDGYILPHSARCCVTGWGRQYKLVVGPTTGALQQALLPVVDYATCSRPDWWGSRVTEKMICAGGDGVAAACNGDSGGPLNCAGSDGTWEVHGVLSFSSGLICNYVRKPNIFTRVSAYIDWISKSMASY